MSAARFNAIVVHGEALGSSMYFGLGAGMMPTATAVVADLMEVARNLRRRQPRPRVAPLGYPLARQRTRASAARSTSCDSEYYLRFMVQSIARACWRRIAGILGQHDISIASVIQKEREHGAQRADRHPHPSSARARTCGAALRADRSAGGVHAQVGLDPHRGEPRQ